jgi:hypothetical protein
MWPTSVILMQLPKASNHLGENSPNLARCYDFYYIFAEKFSDKFGIFDSKYYWFMQKNS